MKRKAIILGIKGYKLTVKEKKLFKKNKPWGLILFSRNIKNLSQLKKLVNEVKIVVNDKYYPVLIDQEGGRVTRLNNIFNFKLFSQNYFESIYINERKNFIKIYKMYIDKVSEILVAAGININTVPVLDVKRKNSHNIIGDRSFSENPEIVSAIGNICINLFKKNKIATVMKHIPGHGLSKKDSHKELPTIRVNKKELMNVDFKPFKKCSAFFALTAHIIYSVYDPSYNATHSKIIIKKIIRKHIGFKGLLISDDISMKALKDGFINNAIKALNAGCNLVLHCNGNIKEMTALLKIIPNIDKFTQKKTSEFYKFLR